MYKRLYSISNIVETVIYNIRHKFDIGVENKIIMLYNELNFKTVNNEMYLIL